MLSTSVRVLIACVALAGAMLGMQFDPDSFDGRARWDAFIPDVELWGEEENQGSCGRYVSDNLRAAGLKLPRMSKLWWGLRGGCHYGDGTPGIAAMFDQAEQLGITADTWTWPDLPNDMGDIRNGLGGQNPHFFIWGTPNTGMLDLAFPYVWHAGKFLRDSTYAAHNDRNREEGIWDDFFERLDSEDVRILYTYHIPEVPDSVNGCNSNFYYWTAD